MVLALQTDRHSNTSQWLHKRWQRPHSELQLTRAQDLAWFEDDNASCEADYAGSGEEDG